MMIKSLYRCGVCYAHCSKILNYVSRHQLLFSPKAYMEASIVFYFGASPRRGSLRESKRMRGHDYDASHHGTDMFDNCRYILGHSVR